MSKKNAKQMSLVKANPTVTVELSLPVVVSESAKEVIKALKEELVRAIRKAARWGVEEMPQESGNEHELILEVSESELAEIRKAIESVISERQYAYRGEAAFCLLKSEKGLKMRTISNKPYIYYLLGWSN